MDCQMLSVGDCARLIGRGCRPRDITMAFYEGRLRTDICIMAGGRRLVPASYVSTVEDVLARMGKLDGVRGGGL